MVVDCSAKLSAVQLQEKKDAFKQSIIVLWVVDLYSFDSQPFFSHAQQTPQRHLNGTLHPLRVAEGHRLKGTLS